MKIERPAADTVYSPNDGRSGESVVSRLVACVAAAKDVEPTELPPITDRLDPDALDVLFPASGDGHCSATLEFAEMRVDISEGGDIWVTHPADAR